MPQTASAIAAGKSVTALAISMQSPPDMVIGQAYSYQLSPVVSGGTPPYGAVVYAASGLPSGVGLSASGLLSGTPTNATTYTVTATVTADSGN